MTATAEAIADALRVSTGITAVVHTHGEGYSVEPEGGTRAHAHIAARAIIGSFAADPESGEVTVSVVSDEWDDDAGVWSVGVEITR